MADEPSASGISKALLTGSVSLAGTLLVAIIIGLFSMSQKVALNDERHQQMFRVDEAQSTTIDLLIKQQQEMLRQLVMLQERQSLNIRAVESHSTLIGGVVSMNSEQQYQIGLIQQRLRILERQMPPEQP